MPAPEGDGTATDAPSARALPLRRGLREEYTFRRAQTLKQLASELLIPLLCKPAGHGCSLTAQETTKWDELKSFLVKLFPGISEPYMINDAQARACMAHLRSDADLAFAQLAIDYARLVAFAIALIHAWDATLRRDAFDEQAAGHLLDCADALAEPLSPFSAKDRHPLIQTIISLRIQAVLLLEDEEHLHGDGEKMVFADFFDNFPKDVDVAGRKAAKFARENFQAVAKERRRLRYPYEDLLGRGIDLARRAFADLYSRDPEPLELGVRAQSRVISFSSGPPVVSRDEQVRNLLDEAIVALSSPWQAPLNEPILGAETYQKLAQLPSEVLTDLLSSITRIELPDGRIRYALQGDADPDASSPKGSPHLRFGPNGLTRARGSAPAGKQARLLETQSDGSQVIFYTQAEPVEEVAEPSKKRKRKKTEKTPRRQQPRRATRSLSVN